MRYRSKRHPVELGQVHRYVEGLNRFSGSAFSDWHTFDGSVFESKKGSEYLQETWDKVTPGFFRAKREGALLPVNPFITEKSVEVKRSSPFHFGRKQILIQDPSSHYHQIEILGDPVGFYFSTNRRGTNNMVPPEIPQAMIDALFVKARAEINSGNLDLLTSAAEFGKTLDLVKNVGSRSLARAQQIRRSFKRNLSYKEFLDAWMEYRYGWRLLMFDIEALNEAIGHFDQVMTRFTAHDSVEVEGNPSSFSKSFYFTSGGSSSGSGAIGGAVATCHGLVTPYSKTSIRAGIGVLGVTPNVVTNLAQTTYELIPWSFVADFFSNLQENVQSMSASVAVNHAFTTSVAEVGFRVNVNGTQDFAWSRGYRSITLANQPGVGTLSSTRLVRTPIDASDVSSFAFRLENNLNASKVMDLLALSTNFKTLKRLFS